MKSKKWLTYTLGALLTLVVLAVVAGAGFRIGMMQNVSFTRGLDGAGHPAFNHNFDGNVQPPEQGNEQQGMQGNPHQGNGDFQGVQGNPHQENGNFQRMQGNNFHGNDRRGGGAHFFSPIFGLIRLVVLGALLWFGYKFVQKSGWKLTRVAATSAPAPIETPNVEGGSEEKKEEA